MAKASLLILLLLAMLCSSALAAPADEYWTLKDDIYYHSAENCGGAGRRVPISGEAAAVFGKAPCHICIQEADEGSDIESVMRGGTIVLRISDKWMESFDTSGVFGFSSPGYYGNEAAWDKLGEMLHGDALAAFLNDYGDDGSAAGEARVPCVLCTNGELLMNQRHIGAHWYVTIRPAEKFKRSWDMYWRINDNDITMTAGGEIDRADTGIREYDHVFSSEFVRQTIEEHKTLTPESMDGAKAVFEKKYGSLEFFLFEGLEGHIGVLYENGADKDLLEAVELRIGSEENAFAISGYMNGDKAVYVFVLTNAEVHAIRNEDAALSVYRKPITEDAEYMDTPYAGVRKGSKANHSGIIDREGNFVLEPVYNSVSRPHPESFRITAPRHFFVKDASGNVLILHGDTLQEIAMIKTTGDYISPEYMNPSVFKLRFDGGMKICSFRDGSVLQTIPYGKDGNYIDNINDIDGHFRILADGEPDCLVVNKGDMTDSECYLVNIENFQRTSESFNRITPLIWKGEKGIFLVENHSCEEMKDSFSGELQSYFEYGRVYDGGAYGDSWRCGLIDEEGAIVAPLEYTSIEVISEKEIRLGTPDGAFKTIRLFE